MATCCEWTAALQYERPQAHLDHLHAEVSSWTQVTAAVVTYLQWTTCTSANLPINFIETPLVSSNEGCLYVPNTHIIEERI